MKEHITEVQLNSEVQCQISLTLGQELFLVLPDPVRRQGENGEYTYLGHDKYCNAKSLRTMIPEFIAIVFQATTFSEATRLHARMRLWASVLEWTDGDESVEDYDALRRVADLALLAWAGRRRREDMELVEEHLQSPMAMASSLTLPDGFSAGLGSLIRSC